MQKVVINSCYGGFGLSEKVCEILGLDSYEVYELSRTCPELIRLMEEKGSEFCSGDYAKLKIVEIPDDVEWEIEEYDGKERIVELHRVWS